MVRWTFVFKERSIRIDTKTDKEDQDIAARIKKKPGELLFLAGDKFNTHVNLRLVECILREVVSDEQIKQEQAAALAAAMQRQLPTGEVMPAIAEVV